jgi:hypothetical protein
MPQKEPQTMIEHLFDRVPDDDLDLRTTEEIEEDFEETAESFREFLTGLPARPGVIR